MPDRASFNLQIFACCCFVVAICFRSARKPAFTHEQLPVFWSRAGLLCIALLTCLAYGPSLLDPLLSDDYILIHASASSTALVKTFTQPAGDGAMRPVGELVFGTFKFWAHEDPLKWHLLGLALHLVNTFLLYQLCRRFPLSASTSLFASALFALHPAHPEAVAWTSSTFDLLATMFSLLTLIALTFQPKALALVVAPILTALAILSKESAYALPAIALLVLENRRTVIYPCLLVALALFLHRWQVFDGPGGYLDPTTGHPQILSVTIVSALKALVYRPWLPLLVPVNWSVPPGIGLKVLLGLTYVSLGVLVLKCRTPRGSHLLLIVAVIASLIPPIHLVLIGSDLQGTRVFYLPTVLFCLWFGQIPRNWALAGAVLIFCFFALRHNLAIRSGVAMAANRACRAGANAVAQSGGTITVQGLPRSLDGVVFFANGFQECVCSASGRPDAKVVTIESILNAPVLKWIPGSRELR